MTKIEFADKLEKYNVKKQRDKWLFLLISALSFLLGYLFQGTSSYSILLILGVGWFVRFIINWSGTEETELLITAVQLLSQNKNT